MAETQISLSLILGFGWCAQKAPTIGDDGERIFTYRFLPPGLWSNDVGLIHALVNTAAQVFPSFEEYPPDLLPAIPNRGDLELTPAGLAFWESCPMYGKLTAMEPWLTWDQHHPAGGVAWTARANVLEPFVDEILSLWPVDLWAAKFMEPWKSYLDPHPKHGHRAMYMQGPLPPSEEPREVEEGWESGLDHARADIHERVEAPWGLHKVLLISCAEDRVSGCKQMEFSDRFRLMPCSLAVRTSKGEPFKWREHHVFRFETPIHFVPRNIKWAMDGDVAHPGGWSARTVVPCYAWDGVDVRFQMKPDEAGWEMTAIVMEPLESLDPVKLAKIEHDLETMPGPPKP